MHDLHKADQVNVSDAFTEPINQDNDEKRTPAYDKYYDYDGYCLDRFSVDD